MEKGFLTKTNKFEIIETFIKPTIQTKYQLTIESIPNFTKIYDTKARGIYKLNPNNTLIQNNMLLLKELIGMFKTIYENSIVENKIKQTKIDNAMVKNEIISHSNNIRETLEPHNESQKSETNEPNETNETNETNENNEINEGLKDEELKENDTNNMLAELVKQRNVDVTGTKIENNNTIENIQPNKITQPTNDNIIELDDNMTFKIQFNKTKKPDILYIKKILLFIEVMDEDILDIPYFKVNIDFKTRYFFNNGLNGNYCIFDICLDLPINIKNNDTLKIELNKPDGEIYKQNNVLLYLNY
tara:strand:- start:557 stop:1462 length:906 start_codon:yes stop_codon:yes gene_type:complete